MPDIPLIRRLLRVSVPAAIDSLSVAACQLLVPEHRGPARRHPAAAHGIALQWEALGYLAGAAFGTAAMVLVGQNLARRTRTARAQSGADGVSPGGAVMGTMGAAFAVLAVPMFRLFCHEEDTQPVIDAGVPVLAHCFGNPALASQIVFTSAPAVRGGHARAGPD